MEQNDFAAQSVTSPMDDSQISKNSEDFQTKILKQDFNKYKVKNEDLKTVINF